MDYLFSKNIEIELVVKNSETNEEYRPLFEFKFPKDEDQFSLIAEIDDVSKFEEIAKQQEKGEEVEMDNESISSTFKVRRAIMEIMSKNLITATGFDKSKFKNPKAYINALEPYIRNELITQFMNRTMEGFTDDSGKKFHLLDSSTGTIPS